jgi:hypothetical protein
VTYVYIADVTVHTSIDLSEAPHVLHRISMLQNAAVLLVESRAFGS